MSTRGEIGEIGGAATVDGDGSSSSSSSSSGSGGNYGSSGGDYDEYIDEERGSGMTTRGQRDGNGANDNNDPREYVNWGDEKGPDPYSSLVVLKCLKPISERKIRRELLVLTHCTRQRLPNLARLIGIVLPDSMDENDNGAYDDDDEADGHADHDLGGGGGGGGEGEGRRKDDSAAIQTTNDHDELSLPRQKAAAAAALDRRKRRRCRDAPPSSSTFGHRGTRERLQRQHTWGKLPALVLEHAGPESQWLCHNGRRQQRHQRRHDVPPGRESDDGNDDEREDDHLSEREVKYYLCHLLIALDALHAAGIMHRDVKPRNTLINRLPSRDGENDRHRRSRRDDEYGNGGDGLRSPRRPRPPPPPPLMLVDLGLADFYHPGKSYNVRVASRHYKSPELLIGYEEYDYSVDMWAFGCILVGLLFRREPFFHGKDNDDQLGQIVNVLGIRDFLRYYRRVGRLRSSRRRGGGGASDGDEVNGNVMRLSYKARAAIGKYCSLAPHSTYSSSSSLSSSEEEETLSGSTPNSDGLDLLDKLLVYDHELRWTAREALGHQFFDEVRHQVLGETTMPAAAWAVSGGSGLGDSSYGPIGIIVSLGSGRPAVREAVGHWATQRPVGR
ncbi:hypothetical protein ACHAW5_006993 [Stephanodiscus triporus]|uniref:non-specific serine/threonine protein kinase n=1 Tax=Stephanodiscus triporus TaxID=2934178 RepID=A0ABD3Q6C6_9STRA